MYSTVARSITKRQGPKYVERDVHIEAKRQLTSPPARLRTTSVQVHIDYVLHGRAAVVHVITKERTSLPCSLLEALPFLGKCSPVVVRGSKCRPRSGSHPTLPSRTQKVQLPR